MTDFLQWIGANDGRVLFSITAFCFVAVVLALCGPKR